MKARDRHVCALTAAGYSADEITKMGVCGSVRTVQRIRTSDEGHAYIQERGDTGLTPHDVLTALLYSRNEATRLKAAVSLAGLEDEPEDAVTAGPRIEVIAAPE